MYYYLNVLSVLKVLMYYLNVSDQIEWLKKTISIKSKYDVPTN